MDRKSFEKLAKRARPAIVAAVAPIVGDVDTAQDVAQDTLLKLWSLGDKLDSYANPQGLAMRIGHNLAIDELRRRRPDMPIDYADFLITDMDADTELLRGECREEIDSVLASLPDTMATIIRMRHVEGMEIAEIAKLTCSTEGAVRVALSRGRRRVKEMFIKRTNI